VTSTNSTLLAAISSRLSAGEENLATESLCFILGRSPAARTAFVNLLAQVLGLEIPAVTFGTQAVDPDGTIPDLVGRDADGRPLVYVESKFWAGLTDTQPVGYLERLRREEGLGLVVLAPANRLSTLWPELSRRCLAAGIVGDVDHNPGHYLLKPAAAPALALTSWNTVLAGLLHECAVSGDTPAAEDLRQLQGLCERMERAGFLPLRGEELTGNVAQRMEDYCGLADDLTADLVACGLASVTGLRQATGRDNYTRYLTLKGNGGSVAFHAAHWRRVFPTPLWLRLAGPDWKPSSAIRHAVGAMLAADPPRAFLDESGRVLFPLVLPTGRERPDVLAALVGQVVGICDLIPEGRCETAPPDEATG